MSRHIIHQQAIEIGATDRSSAQPVFLEISRLFNNRAKDAAGYILDKYDQENELIKLDVLEVDIGTIPFPFSEESFVKIYSEKLEEALAGAIKKQLQLLESREQQSDSGGTKRSLLQLLEQFLLTGTIAWWAGKEELKDPVRLFKTLREKEMSSLQAMIVRLFPEGTVRKRLVYSFIEETIKTVIGIIQPTEKEFIVRYHARVSYLQTENRFVRTDNTGFRKVLWLFILDFLADQSGSRFNRKMFVRSTLAAIAQRFNMRFDELLFFFSEALKDIPENFRRTENLLSLVEEIAFEQALQAGTAINASSGLSEHSESTEHTPDEQALFFFLLNGFFPIGISDKSDAALNADLMNVIQHHLAYTQLFFVKHGSSADVRTRLLRHFTVDSMKAVVQIAEPAGFDLIISYVSFITQLWKKTRFVQAEEKLFHQIVWELTLSGVFLAGGPVFHAKSFLAIHQEAMARYYGVDLVRFQAALVQGTVQQDSVNNSQSGLFFLLAEIFSDSKTSRHGDYQSLQSGIEESIHEQAGQEQAFKENKITPEQDASESFSKTADVVHEQAKQKYVPEKPLSLLKLLDGAESAINEEQKSLLIHAVLHVLESGKLPEWSGLTGISVEAFIGRMRVSYPVELRTALLYVAKTGKVGFYVLHHYAPLFKTEFIFLFEAIFPDKLLLFFKELQARYAAPDVSFAQGLLMAIAESSDEKPDLTVFFSYVLNQIRTARGEEDAKIAAFQMATFSSLKENSGLKQAFEKAATEYAYINSTLNREYSAGNFRQVLILSVTEEKSLTESGLPASLVKWITYYASYQRLPSALKLTELISEKLFIAWAMEFLFRDHRHLIQELFSESGLSMGEQVLLSELVQHAGAVLQVRHVVEEQVRRRLFAHDTALAKRSPDSPESWKWLMQQLAEQPSDKQVYTRIFTLMKQESSRALMAGFVADKELKQLFEKNNQPEWWLWYRHFEEVSSELFSGMFERRQFRIHVVEFFLALLAREIQIRDSVTEIATRFVGFLLSKSGNVLIRLQEQIEKSEAAKNTVLSAQATELLSYLSIALKQVLRRIHALKTIEREIKVMEKGLHFRVNDQDKKRLQDEQNEGAEIKNTLKDKTPAFGEQVYIRNAGMILLHPFLATLFARAGLTKEGVFTGEDAQAKAVQLLQYAVTGTEQDPEYDLVLNKLLAGLQPGDVLEYTTGLEADQKELITGMIHAIMMQWDKMKNTSLDGFRNAFLMREGYVFQTEESWVLRVEQRGYDVILQTLPWSFGMIKFSWMTKPLIVEWN